MARGELLPNNDYDVEDVTFDVDTGNQPRTRADSMLDDLLTELNDTSDQVTLRVYRQTGNGQESMQFVEAMAPDKYTSDELMIYLRDSYGPGDYRIQVRRNGKIAANKLISIAVKKVVSRETSSNDSALLQAIQAMQDQIAQQNQTIARMMQQPQGNSKGEFLKEMMIYKELFADKTPKQSGGVGELLQSVEALKSLGINVGIPGVEDKDEDSFSGMLDKATPLLMQLLSQPKQAAPQPQTAPYQQNPKERTPEMMQQIKRQAELQKLKLGVSTLVTAANKGVDPSVYAEMITNTFDQPLVDKYLSAPDMFKIVCDLNPKAAPHQEWFNDLREHINAIYERPSKFSADYAEYFQESENDAINGEIENSPTGDSPNGDNV